MLGHGTSLGDLPKPFFKDTFDPLGIIFYSTKGRSIAHASVNNGITGQEVSHCGRIQLPIWNQSYKLDKTAIIILSVLSYIVYYILWSDFTYIIATYTNKSKPDAQNQPVTGWPTVLSKFTDEGLKHQKVKWLIQGHWPS